MNRNKVSLKWKIFAFLLGFCALLLVILWVLQTVFLNDMYRFIRKQELKEVIALVEKEINNPELQTILNRIQTEKDITVMPTHNFVLPRKPDMEGQGKRGNREPDTIIDTKEFTLSNGKTISFTFHVLIAPVTATIKTLRTQMYLITVVMLILSVLLAIVIAKRISKPMEEISKSAQSLARGNYDTHFSGSGFYEIMLLSDTLNMAAAELGKAESLRRELLANVSHDLRTPLSLIYSYAEMMNDFPSEITSDQIQTIMDETKRLTTLVNDVLDLSKLESNMEQLHLTQFNLTQSVLDTVERMKELLKKEEFDICCSYDNEAYVIADEAKISRAFYNLLINAVNYSGNSRSISVVQTISNAVVRVSITDCGEGISKGELPFIWDRYYKSGKKHKRAVTGTGLGLSIVKKIIELHKGKYGVTSEAGKGSTFWFEIESNNH